MAYLVGILTSKRGNIIPGATVIAREDSNPSGDTGQAVALQNASYKIQVGLSATLYKLYANSEEGGVDGPNFAGWAVSSGNVLASFVLLSDSDWKIEHYGTGEAQTAGTHKSITADDIEFRTGGFIKHADQYFDFRLGSDTRRLRIDSSLGDNVIWFNPKPVSGADNYHIGLHEGFGTIRAMYFGSAKTYYIRTDGQYYLNDGTFAGAGVSNSTWEFKDLVTFNNTHPRQNSYVAPTLDNEYAPKKYVDDLVSGVSETQYGLVPVWVLKMVSDTDQGGSEPGAPSTGDAYIANNWGGSYIDDHIYEYDGATFIDVMGSAISDGDKIVVKKTGAAGSFSGHASEIGTYNGSTWSFNSPEHGDAIVITGDGSQYEWQTYFWNSFDSDWDKEAAVIAHNDTSGKQGGQSGQYYHFTSAQHTDLTDGNDSTLHYHAADRARANHTGTQIKSTISDFAHQATHNNGGGDALKLDDLASPNDNTDLNVSTSAHGLTPKLDNDTTHFLNGQGGYTAPTGGYKYISITIEDPTSSEAIPMFYTNKAITVQEIQAAVKGSSTPSVTIDPYHSTDVSGGGSNNDILDAPVAITNTTIGQNISDFTPSGDPTVPTDSWIVIETTAQSGTVTDLIVTIRYTED